MKTVVGIILTALVSCGWWYLAIYSPIASIKGLMLVITSLGTGVVLVTLLSAVATNWEDK